MDVGKVQLQAHSIELVQKANVAYSLTTRAAIGQMPDQSSETLALIPLNSPDIWNWQNRHCNREIF